LRDSAVSDRYGGIFSVLLSCRQRHSLSRTPISGSLVTDESPPYQRKRHDAKLLGAVHAANSRIAARRANLTKNVEAFVSAQTSCVSKMTLFFAAARMAELAYLEDNLYPGSSNRRSPDC
jgi:hypothetical protein